MILGRIKRPEGNGRQRDAYLITCDSCEAQYTRFVHAFKEGTVHGCSPKCVATLKGQAKIVNCAMCDVEVRKRSSEIEQSKSGLLFCSVECKHAAMVELPELRPNKPTGLITLSNYRESALEAYGAVCALCGYEDNIKALDVHHLDHNRSNNELINLQVLCCNCHAIEHRNK